MCGWLPRLSLIHIYDIADIVLVAVAGTAGQRVLLKHMDVVALHLGPKAPLQEESTVRNALALFGSTSP